MWRGVRKSLKINKNARWYWISQMVITFSMICFAWIFFRANSLDEGFFIVKKIVTDAGKVFIGEWQQLMYGLFGISLLLFIEFSTIKSVKPEIPFYSRYWFKEQLVYASFIILILLTGVFDGGQFIYFKF
jgi:hypothetical protein